MKTTAIKRGSTSTGLFAAVVLLAPVAGWSANVQVLDQVTDPQNAIHKKLEVYGTVRLSFDYSDSDVSANEADTSALLSDGDFSVSSNTSTIGFRGRTVISQGYTALWQYEQQVDVDDRDDGDSWTTRDSFLGLDSPLGVFLVGYVNTPFKNMGVRFMSPFNTTVADPHAIFGASSNAGGRLDKRGANSITWKNRLYGVDLALQYAADQSGSIHTVDDNDRDSFSASALWSGAGLDLGAAYINYSAAPGAGEIDAYRLSAKYKIGRVRIGGLFESIDADLADALSRDAYGVQLGYTINRNWSLVTQWNHANVSNAGDDEADQYSLGVFDQLTDSILIHAVASTTRNDGNAAYRGVDYAHGDYLGTLPGRNPWSVSVGAQLKF